MTKQTFSKEPYFDDFDKSKNFMRVLFKTEKAIQTRELNQLQSIFNTQIESFADHIFKFGSRVDAGSVKYENDVHYVRLKDLDTSGNAVEIGYITNKNIKGRTSGVTATVKHAEEKDNDNPNTIFVNYTGAGIDGETIRFIDGEIIDVIDSGGYTVYSFYVRCPTCETDPDEDTIDPIGRGTTFSCSDSTYYVYGYFVECDQQTIVLDKYSSTPTCKVGLEIQQEIIDSSEDESLYDNALGQANFAESGADRYKITLKLTKKDLNDETDDNFIHLGTVVNGILTEVENRPQYSDIMDMIARRTYDESGDYTVRPFIITPKEHLKTSTTDTTGIFTVDEGGQEDKIVAVASSGKAYVKGYEIDKISKSIIPINKARDTEKKSGAVIRKKFGNYLLVKILSASNFIPGGAATTVDGRKRSVYDFTDIDVYDAPIGASLTTAGTKIGTIKAKGMEIYKLDGVTYSDTIWKLNIIDVQLDPGKTISADAIGLLATGMENGTSFGANIEQDNYIFFDLKRRVFETGENTLLYKVPYNFVKSIHDVNNQTETRTILTTPAKYYSQADSGGTLKIAASGDETFTSFNQRTWFLGKLNTTNYEPVYLDPADITVTNNTITIVNLTINAHYFLVAETLLANVPEKTKTLTELVLDDVAANATSISLTKADVQEIKKIEMWDSATYATYALADAASALTDVTDNYTLTDNIKDNYYGISTIDLDPDLATPAADMVVRITFDYFLHTNTTDGGYFSIDSYETTINDPLNNFTYEDVPTYISSNGTIYNLSDTLDFRPIKDDLGEFSGTDYIPSNNKNIIFDVEYYLPRKDILVLTENGNFVDVEGEPSLTPKYPNTPDNAMAIYKVDLDPYTFDPIKSTKFKYVDNKRYTMRDIGKLDERIKNLQYYVSLNLLDQSLDTMTITDANGDNRYKNGFLSDGFNDLRSGNTGSIEYRCAIDPEKGELRPRFNKKLVNMLLDESASSNYQISSSMVTLPWSHEIYDFQPYASKTISVTPYFVFASAGNMSLLPQTDVWNEETVLPDLIVDVDTGLDSLREIADATGVLGTIWNTTTNSDRISSIFSRWTEALNTSGGFGIDATVQSGIETGTTTTVAENVTSQSLGEYVTDVQLLTYIRSQDVQFYASNLAKNTRMYAFFDDVDVNDNVRPLNGAIGDPLITDENGVLVGVFTIPNEEEKRFYVGTRKFRLTNTSDNSTDPDELISFAESNYHAGGLAQTKQSTILSVTTPQIEREDITRPVSWTDITGGLNRFDDGQGGGGDPLAQSFMIKEDTGIFVSKIDLFFSEKGETDGVWLEIREMVNGYPGAKMLPYGRLSKNLDNIFVSDDGNVPTTFEFEAPVYLMPNTEYCFIIGSSDKNNRIFASKLGDKDILTGSVISTQPHMGSVFKGQNNRTWNAAQYEDLKFNLYRAKFDVASSMNLSIVPDNIPEATLASNPIETESGSDLVRIHHENHGFSDGDKVKLNLLTEDWFEIQVVSGNIIAGQTLTGATNGGTAIIKSVKSLGYDNGTGNYKYNVKLKNITGYFGAAETVTAPITYETVDSSKTSVHDYTETTTGHLALNAYFPDGVDNTFNGIPLNELSQEFIIDTVDTMDSYIIQTTTSATVTGKTGGVGNKCVGHAIADALELNISSIDYTGESSWTYNSVYHKTIGSSITDYTTVSNQKIIPNATTELNTPIKIVNSLNETYKNSGNPTFVGTGVYSSDSDYVSPVVNIETISVYAIRNRIEWNDCLTASIAPNATTDGGTLVCGTNGRFVEEDQTNKIENGSEKAKYVTRVINLKNPANYIDIFADVVNYTDSDIDFYYRILDAASEESIKDVPWTKLTYTKPVSETSTDFKEIEINIPNKDDITLPQAELDDFKAFQIKIVMRSKNSAKMPKVKRFRCIATT